MAKLELDNAVAAEKARTATDTLDKQASVLSALAAAQRKSGLTAEAAIERVRQRMQTRMRQIDDPLLQDRMHDLDDLSNRLLRIVSGQLATAAYRAGGIFATESASFGGVAARAKEDEEGKRAWECRLLSLDQARARFETFIGGPIRWHESD